MFLYLNIKYIRNFKGTFNVPSPPLVSSSRSFINNNPITLLYRQFMCTIY